MPRIRFERATCDERTTNPYRRTSIDGIELTVSGVDPYQKVELGMVPDRTTNLTEINKELRDWKHVYNCIRRHYSIKRYLAACCGVVH
jgi:hypothetical protein